MSSGKHPRVGEVPVLFIPFPVPHVPGNHAINNKYFKKAGKLLGKEGVPEPAHGFGRDTVPLEAQSECEIVGEGIGTPSGLIP